MRFKALTAFILLLLAFAACKKSKETKSSEPADTIASEKPQLSLKLKWETDTVLTTCESVVYDSQKDILYVSNIDGAPEEKDGKGAISQVTLDGAVANRDWITGLNAPKGMGIYNGKLYVSDIDQIVEIDIEGGKILNKYPVEGAKFLNDVAITDDGVVLVSDTQSNMIVQLENNAVTVYMDSVSSPNGLFIDGGKLMVAHWGDKNVVTVDMETKESTGFADGLSNPDGIEAADGGYLVSNWEGEVTHVSSEGEKKVLLDTKEAKLNAADIEFIPEKKLLLVPAFFANKVMAYELVKN